MSVSISEASRNLSHWVNQASYGRECVTLTSRGRPKAVLISVEAFEALLGIQTQSTDSRSSVEQLRQEFRQALNDAGYSTKDEIVALVQEVRREIANEHVIAG